MNEDQHIDDLIVAHRDAVHPTPPHLKQQWHAAIDRAAALEQQREQAGTADRSRRFGSLFWGAAVGAALVIGIAIGLVVSNGSTLDTLGSPQELPQIADVSPQENVIPAAFTRGLSVYLRDSKLQLESLDPEVDSAILILQIIEQNRLFETIAEQKNAPQLARVLRAFEPILLRLSASDIAPADAEALRAKLSFELNVMLTKLARESSDETHST